MTGRTRWPIVAAAGVVMACSRPPLPIAGIWQLDTAHSRYGGGVDRRIQEEFTCSERDDQVRCAILSVRASGTQYFGQFEATVGGPRARVTGMDADAVQVSYTDPPVMQATFYWRGQPTFAYSARRRHNDTLEITALDPVSRAPLNSVVIYTRLARTPLAAPD